MESDDYYSSHIIDILLFNTMFVLLMRDSAEAALVVGSSIPGDVYERLQEPVFSFFSPGRKIGFLIILIKEIRI